MRFLTIILVLFTLSCTPSFQRPHYKQRNFKKGWHHRRLPIFKTATYRNPTVKKEARQKLLKPGTINFDEW